MRVNTNFIIIGTICLFVWLLIGFSLVSASAANFGISESAIEDGSFEAGIPNPYWGESSTNWGTPLCETVPGCLTFGDFNARTGNVWAFFGGPNITEAEEGWLTQTLTIPSGYTSLEFWWSVPGCGNDIAYLEALIDGVQVFVNYDNYSHLCGIKSYWQETIDISLWADGDSHNLAFHSESGLAGCCTSFFLDDISISSPWDYFVYIPIIKR